jgi:hypothetical protein
MGISNGAKTTGRRKPQHRAETAIPDDQFFAIQLLVLCRHDFVGQPGVTTRIANGPKTVWQLHTYRLTHLHNNASAVPALIWS